MNYLERAKEILEEQSKDDFIHDSKARAIAPYVKEVLLQFADAEPEFAQAICQSSGTFSECCETCVSGIGTAVSDKDVYTAAAQYYFPGCGVEFEMRINLVGNAHTIAIDFTDFC